MLSNQLADSSQYSINKKGVTRGPVHARRRGDGPPSMKLGQTLSQEWIGIALIWVRKHSQHGEEHREVSTGGIR